MSKISRRTSSSDELKKKKKKESGLNIEGYSVEGISVAGQETCIIFPSLNIAFDIGKCPRRAVNQQFLFISHAHMDHIGGLPMYVATRGLLSLEPPTIFVPKAIKEVVEKLFEVHREMDNSDLKHNLVALDIGEEFFIKKDLKVKAFKTYHVIPSQGYTVYTIKQKLKLQYVGLPGNEIKELKLSGTEITNTTVSPEIAFTGDTTADFVTDPANVDVLTAKILIMECTFLHNRTTVDFSSKEEDMIAHARKFGHIHIDEVAEHVDRFQNKAILFIHFSARYQADEIREHLLKLPKALDGRVFALTEGFYSQDAL